MNREEFIARINHIAWSAYMVGIELSDPVEGFNMVEPDADLLESIIHGVKNLDSNPGTMPKDSHNNWMKLKLSQGWKYGKVRDNYKKTHPDLVPFEEMPEKEKMKDALFIIAYGFGKRLWKKLKEGNK